VPATHAVPGQTTPQTPQLLGSVARLASQPSTERALQSAVPGRHDKTQTPPVHVGVAFGALGHGRHAAPQAVGSFADTHFLVHARKPGLQVNVQRPAMQAASPWSTAGHFVAQSPQWLTLESRDAHSFPQSVGVSGEHPPAQSKLVPDGAQSGFEGGQAAPHRPQLVGLDRSVSHPSVATSLQSA
jgi:hypothetical protein